MEKLNISQLVTLLADKSALFFYNRDKAYDTVPSTLSDDRPNILIKAATIWNFACIEKAEIINDKLILYARDPYFLISGLPVHKDLWDFLQNTLEAEENLTLGIAKFDDDFLAPIDPVEYTFDTWSLLGAHLKQVADNYCKGDKKYIFKIFNEENYL